MLYGKAQVRIIQNLLWVNDYQLLATLGQGAFGEVVLAAKHSAESNTTKKVAVKCFSKNYLLRQREVRRTPEGNEHFTALDRVYSEIAILEHIGAHKNVSSILEVLDECDGDDLYVVLELANAGVSMTHSIENIRDLGPWAQRVLENKVEMNEDTPVFEIGMEDLSDLYGPSDGKSSYYKFVSPSTKVPYSIEQCAIFLFDLANGIRHIHSKKVAHRDIKPENLLLTSDGRLVIGDFGVAVRFAPLGSTNRAPSGSPTSTQANSPSHSDSRKVTSLASPSHPGLPLDWVTDTAGSYLFLSPEAAAGEGYSAFEADIWAIGVSLYCFLFGMLPFGTFMESPLELFEEIQHSPLKPHPFHCAADPKRTEADIELIDLVEKLLSRDKEFRIRTVDGILNHKFMQRYKIVDSLPSVEESKVADSTHLNAEPLHSCDSPSNLEADLSERKNRSGCGSAASRTLEGGSPISVNSAGTDPMGTPDSSTVLTNVPTGSSLPASENAANSLSVPIADSTSGRIVLVRPSFPAVDVDKLSPYTTPELSLHLYQQEEAVKRKLDVQDQSQNTKEGNAVSATDSLKESTSMSMEQNDTASHTSVRTIPPISLHSRNSRANPNPLVNMYHTICRSFLKLFSSRSAERSTNVAAKNTQRDSSRDGAHLDSVNPPPLSPDDQLAVNESRSVVSHNAVSINMVDGQNFVQPFAEGITQGRLLRKTQYLKRNVWQYCQLRDGKMYFYDESPDLSGVAQQETSSMPQQPRWIVSLADIVSVSVGSMKDNPLRFEIRSRDATVSFVAPSEEELQSWVLVLSTLAPRNRSK